MFETWYLMSAMLGSGLDVSSVITDRFPASEWETAFRTAREGAGGKVLIEWSER
jgi:threonine 3-dehydrogenase